ncbi:MAG: V-type ATP synthase subunit D [Rectinemataceae bacterium]|jgi:V/A-type H+-transporting ATPase subunit D
MPAQNVAPTKSNLLREKERLALAEEGYELLEQKREILMLELMKRINEARVLEREMRRRAGTAYPVLRRMLLKAGRENARELASGVRSDFRAREKRVQVSGISMPALEAAAPERRLQSSFMNSFADSDETAAEFSSMLELVAAMAGIRAIVWRLAKEVRKTQRRVNALEKMVIPESKAIKSFIEDSLEEREREAVFSTKRLKARKEREAGR